MAARKPADIACMFCGELPCTCEGIKKERKAPAKPRPVVTATVELAKPQASPVRASLSSVAAIARQDAEQERLAGEASEREALTALFKAGFMIERLGDPRGFESVRPMLNMPDVDIDIAIWKMRRKKCLSKS